MVEYAFLLVLLATITFAVVALAGTQLKGMYNDVSFEFTHLLDSNTYAPDGSVASPGTTPSYSCAPGQSLVLRGHKWHCH